MTNAPLSAETIKNFMYASTATVSMQMLKRGFRNTAVSGVRPLNPKASRMVGPAYTLRYVPGREDLDKPPSPNAPPHAQNKAIEETPEGHVLVIGTEGNLRSGTLGDILALRLKVRGVAGVLSDGAMRDTPVIGNFDFPVYCVAAAPPCRDGRAARRDGLLHERHEAPRRRTAVPRTRRAPRRTQPSAPRRRGSAAVARRADGGR